MRAFSRPPNLKTTQNRQNRPKRRFFSNFFLLKINAKYKFSKIFSKYLSFAIDLLFSFAILHPSKQNNQGNEEMETKSTLQILNAELNTCKANAPREKVMVAGGWFIKETAEQTKKDLKEFKAFVKEQFRRQASTLVESYKHSRLNAEKAALETARARIKCWKEAQAQA